MNEQELMNRSWISLIMRFFAAALFIPPVLNIFQMGLGVYVEATSHLFEDTWLPYSFTSSFLTLVPFVQLLLGLWLFVGIRLKLGWILAALYLVIVAFLYNVKNVEGAVVHRFFYVFLCCVGLYVSPYDRWSVDGMRKKD